VDIVLIGGIMKKIKKILVLQIVLAAILLILIVLFFLHSFTNYLPYTSISLENMTILDKTAGG
jgi:hypothetical protein